MSVKTFQEIFLYTSVYAIIIPILLGLRHVKRLPKHLRFFLYFLITALCFDTYSVVTANNNINNMAGLHVYTVVEYACMAYFFSLKVHTPRLKQTILISLLPFAFLAFYYACFMVDLTQYNGPVRTISAVLISAIAVNVIYKEMRHNDFPTSDFYIIAGVLLYFMVNSVGFLLYAAIGKEFGRVVSEQFGIIHSVVYLIASIFYIFGFKNKPTPK